MANLILPSRFNRQPQYPVEIDYGNPLTRGLVSATVPSWDIANKTIVGTKLNPMDNMLGRGFGSTFGVGTTDSFALDRITTHSNTRSYFALAYINGTGGGGFGRIHDKRTVSGQVDAWSTNSSPGEIIFQREATSVQRAQYYVPTLPTLVSMLVSAPPPGTVPKAYVNGAEAGYVGSFSVAGSGSLSTNTDAYVIGNRKTDNARNLDGVIFIHAMWDRLLDEREARELYSNPWQIFRKRPQILYFDVGGGGAFTLTPNLYTNTQTFYNPTVSAGAVALTPSLYTNSQTFYSATITQGGATQGLTPSLYTNTSVFYGPVVTTATALTPSLYTNTNSFYNATVSTSNTLAPSLYTNSNTFYTHLIEVEGGAQNVLPNLYTNTNTFYNAAVSVGSVSLTPALYTNTNSFFAASVATSNTLVAPLVVNTSSLFTHELTQGAAGAQDLQPTLLLNNNSFFVATVTGGAQLRQKDGTSKKKKVDKTKEQLELERIFGKEESTEELILKFINPIVKIPTDVLRKEVTEVATKPTSAVLLDYLVEVKQTVAREEQVKITQAIQQYTEAQVKIKKKKVAKKREEELLLMWMI